VVKSVEKDGKTTDTYYIRDAQGNIMATYEVKEAALVWKEQHLYGSNRLGILETGVPLDETTKTPYYVKQHQLIRGQKRYELSNHLGNVLSVISDLKVPIPVPVGHPDLYGAKVISAADYYPFGLEMPARTLVDNDYRFGFNGKEGDRNGEWGSGVHYDYGFRIYNPKIGKFLSVDPLTGSYPWYTPYQFAGNKPIWAIDVDGLEEFIFQYRKHEDNTVTLIKKISNSELRIQGGYGGAIVTKIDKRTGKPFRLEELGMVQYQYFNANNEQLTIRRTLEGNFSDGKNEFLDLHFENWFNNSIYIGPNNPEIIDSNGDDKADYRREPLDLMDAAALRHDKDYGLVRAKGFIGAVFDKNTILADIALVQRANTVINLYEEKAIDPYTNQPISQLTLDRARIVKSGFTEIIKRKVVGTTQYLFNSSAKFLDEILSRERPVDDNEIQPEKRFKP
jgi:RHS repeat-associated protein